MSNDWDNWEEAFKEADSKQYSTIAQSLAGYRKALMSEGFTRREAMRLVESYSNFIYDLTLNRAEEEEDTAEWEEVDDVDPEDEP